MSIDNKTNQQRIAEKVLIRPEETEPPFVSALAKLLWGTVILTEDNHKPKVIYRGSNDLQGVELYD
jgi:hypothetical protein